MSRSICGICMCPYGDQGDCGCPVPESVYPDDSVADEHDQFNEYLKTNHPVMFPEYAYCECGPGWFNIIKSLCRMIDDHITWTNSQFEKHNRGSMVKPVVVQQIKEKFGSLRFYYNGGDDYVQGLVAMAENYSGQSCEDCGNIGKKRQGGWIRTLCDDHAQNRPK